MLICRIMYSVQSMRVYKETLVKCFIIDSAVKVGKLKVLQNNDFLIIFCCSFKIWQGKYCIRAYRTYINKIYILLCKIWGLFIFLLRNCLICVIRIVASQQAVLSLPSLDGCENIKMATKQSDTVTAMGKHFSIPVSG